MLHYRSTSRRRPALLALVFGVMLVLVGLTASAVVGITGVHLSNSTLEAVVSRDGSLVELFVNGTLQRTDLDGSVSGSRHREVERAMATLTHEDEILRMEIRDADGRVRFATADGGGRRRRPSPWAPMRLPPDGTAGRRPPSSAQIAPPRSARMPQSPSCSPYSTNRARPWPW